MGTDVRFLQETQMPKNTKQNQQKEVYTVGEIAALFGISRKTLFYYDRIGLLKPVSRIGTQGSKLYDGEAIERMRNILAYKDAGLQLKEIQSIFNHPQNKLQILRQAEKRLAVFYRETEQKIAKLEAMISMIHTEEKQEETV